MKIGDKVSPGKLGMKVIEVDQSKGIVLVEFEQLDLDAREFVTCRAWIPASELTKEPPISKN